MFDMMEEIAEMALEAKSYGLAVVIWSYPRGGDLSKEGETAVDVCAYAAHIAALLGAHIIKVKPPTMHIEMEENKKALDKANVSLASLTERIRHVTQACFAGRRLVVFSGGAGKVLDDLYNEAIAIRDGGGNGSIIGRNTFQRPRDEALTMLAKLIEIYRSN
jgi:class I fructose-bisphosphate aldolase